MSHNDNDTLTKALADMKLKEAPGTIWDKIELALDREKGKEYLDRTVAEMKGHHSEAGVWLGVEEKLDVLENQDLLESIISNLPEHTYEGSGFDGIQHRLEHKSEHFPMIRYWLPGVAAMILIWLGMTLYQRIKVDTQRITMDHTEEIQLDVPAMLVDDELQRSDEILTFINEHCHLLAVECKSPRFKGLLDQYIELDTARQDLMVQINQNNGQVQLINYLVRIEKEQNDIGKQLLQILMS